MSNKRNRIPGAGKSFEAVGGAPANPEHHVYVDVDVNDTFRDFESRHTRKTFWVETKLAEKLNDSCNRKGDRTRIINDALRKYFTEE